METRLKRQGTEDSILLSLIDDIMVAVDPEHVDTAEQVFEEEMERDNCKLRPTSPMSVSPAPRKAVHTWPSPALSWSMAAFRR